METPPRAWGRQLLIQMASLMITNTPTGVGKTVKHLISGSSLREHPHGRGEDRRWIPSRKSHSETPPRAWGRPLHGKYPPGKTGNTPTGVGKTHQGQPGAERRKKHPHGRGEDADQPDIAGQQEETPPRAWGRRAPGRSTSLLSRNTPTGVGKTAQPELCSRPQWKHPHGRGEDGKAPWVPGSGEETPPRAWGRLYA